ncbi:hypothetical protein XO10_08995 [Marinitoga sp. 1135]|uniref:Uncharacterized protein n=1 Tax=Marinitoga piezophila (strain DSM 14283 / JCM 11233 / KA3) TaxID=443254 RepID=H2J5Y4_MARPK|nr:MULTISPECIES: hypothetical protein [Marinitoga]AEX86203.1 hypothetical protein Marpi_1822 [Marinitoga piezophila KA3]NUU96391.1 hypothetical protein [Marinitoga sp. 1135]
MKMRKEIIILILSILSGTLGLIFIIKNNKYGYLFIAIYFLLAIIISYSYKKRYSDIFKKLPFFVLFFPFFPFIQYLQNIKIESRYKPVEISEKKEEENERVNFSSVDLAPFMIVLKYGDPEQRKFVVRLVYDAIKNEAIDFSTGIHLLNEAIKIDEHPDVVLYASDAITNLENFLIEKISYYYENLNTLEDYINFGKFSYYYAKSGFLAGEHKQEILWQSALILRTAVHVFPESPELILYLLKTLELLEEYNELEEVLEDKIKNFKAQKIMEYAIFYYIKRKKPKNVQRLVSDYILLGFKPESEALKFLLGG